MAAEVKFSSEDHRPLISPQKVAVVGTGHLGTRIAGESRHANRFSGGRRKVGVAGLS